MTMTRVRATIATITTTESTIREALPTANHDGHMNSVSVRAGKP